MRDSYNDDANIYKTRKQTNIKVCRCQESVHMLFTFQYKNYKYISKYVLIYKTAIKRLQSNEQQSTSRP